MAKKPGSWEKINQITNTVQIQSSRKSVLTYSLLFVFILFLVPLSYFGYHFIRDVLSFGGIVAKGDNPESDDGDYFKVDFSKVRMRENPQNIKNFELVDYTYNESINRKLAMSSNLRLEFAYNEIFDQAPKNFISKNALYKQRFRNPELISINNIYTDKNRFHELSIEDVQTNKIDLAKNILYLDISYNNEPVNYLLEMPTLFVGQEAFLSNFFAFKAQKFYQEGAYPLAWENKWVVNNQFGNMAMLKLNAPNQSLQLNEEIYDFYRNVFTKFYNDNWGYTKEFIGSVNPYENFVLSSFSPKDVIATLPLISKDITIDDSDYLFDINAFLANKIKPLDDNNQNDEVVFKDNFIAQFFVFLKNILVNNDNPDMVVNKDLFPPSTSEIFDSLQPKYYDRNSNDGFYFMFLPHNETLKNILNEALQGWLKDLYDGKLDAKDGKSLVNIILKKITDEEYAEIAQWNIFPFQLYQTSQNADGEFSRRVYQVKNKLEIDMGSGIINDDDQTYLKIEHPEIYHIRDLYQNNLDRDYYDFSDASGRARLINDFWNTLGLYNTNISNTIWINRSSIEELKNREKIYFPSPADYRYFIKRYTKEFLIDQMWYFIKGVKDYTDNQFDIIESTFNRKDLADIINRDYEEINVRLFDKYHQPSQTSLVDWLHNIWISNDNIDYNITTIQLELDSKVDSADKQAKKLVFQFGLRYE